MTRWWTKAFDALASVQLAVVAMSALAVACIAATFYEASRGTAATQRLFYASGWFTALLGLLAVNILFSTIKRYPWTRHHVGFVIAHAGILLLLGGSLVSLHGGLDGRVAVAEGSTTDALELATESVHVGLPDGTHAVMPVSFSATPPLPGTRLPLPGTEAALVIEEYNPHVRLGDVLAEAAGGEAGNPALQFTLAGHHAEAQTGWLVAGDHEQAHAEYGPLAFTLHAADDEAKARALLRTSSEQNVLAFVMTRDGTLRYAISTRKGKPTTGTAVAGQTIATPWMGLTLKVDRVLRSAVRHRVATRLPLPRKDEERTPAVRFRLESGGQSATQWVAFSESQEMALGGGQGHVGYGRASTTLPFKLTLLDFKSEKYPGSRMAATYESRVRVDDPEQGTSVHHIAMNKPLHYRGYTFFQASFVEGEPATSIFSVSRAPGLPLVYLGTVLLSVGVLWLSFFKRWVARRQARRALAARGLGAAPALAVAGAPGSNR